MASTLYAVHSSHHHAPLCISPFHLPYPNPRHAHVQSKCVGVSFKEPYIRLVLLIVVMEPVFPESSMYCRYFRLHADKFSHQACSADAFFVVVAVDEEVEVIYSKKTSLTNPQQQVGLYDTGSVMAIPSKGPG